MILFSAIGFGLDRLLGWQLAFPLGFFVGLIVAPMIPAPGAACSLRLPQSEARTEDLGPDRPSNPSEPRG